MVRKSLHTRSSMTWRVHEETVNVETVLNPRSEIETGKGATMHNSWRAAAGRGWPVGDESE
jgi:hypothetical protein